ncbi:MAG TPA: phosphomannomutase/phosphoglucomutase [Candidatus Woesebacteria bacterium]|nr:phosphomannomutase/phosphoglucomutase [Candidatus Woesebacteria bacterium]
MNNTFDWSVFKAYDIRGIYDQQLDEKLAYALGQAMVSLLAKDTSQSKFQIVVSRDMRPSSKSLSQSLIKGLVDAGATVIDIGLNSTPSFYFAVAYYQYDGGIQITASHNPSEYNGFKLVRQKAKPIGEGTGMEELVEIIKTQQPKKVNGGQIVKLNSVASDQLKFIEELVDLKQIKPFKIVVDAANSVGGQDISSLFSKLPCQLIPLYFELDGTFPNHDADPLKPENLVDIKKEVIKQKADLGIALDGDGDRMFFIDELGNEMPQPILRGMMAQIELAKQPDAVVCYDIRPGKITKDMIDQVHGKSVITKVGHSLIKAKMDEVGAIFGGESSGHYFYKFPFGTFDTPMVLLAKFLVHISRLDQPLSAIIKPFDRYFHSGEINSDVQDKEGAIQRLANRYSDAQISYLDGITITYSDFWFNVRPSNTEPKLRLNLEAVAKEVMEQKRDEVLAIIRQ